MRKVYLRIGKKRYCLNSVAESAGAGLMLGGMVFLVLCVSLGVFGK